MPIGQITRRNGKRSVRTYNSAGTINVGDAVQFDESGEVVVAAAGVEVLGVALTAATSSTTVDVDIAGIGDEWEFPIEAGTMAASKVGTEVDLNSADGVDIGTSTNDDVMITDWDGVSTTSGTVYGTFRKLAKSAGIA